MGGRARWLLWGGLLCIAAAAAIAASAQAAVFTSPGTGQSYTLATLDVAAGGTVAPTGTGCHYHFTDSVVISYGDALSIGAGCLLDFDNGENLTIAGQLVVLGTGANPVAFDSAGGAPPDGAWGGIRFVGPGSAPSTVDNVSIHYGGSGLQCLSCQNLTARYVFVDHADGDGVFVQGGSNLTLVNITQVVTTYNLQSAIGINGATGVNVSGANGTGVADVLTLWNVTNVKVTGPILGTGLGIAVAWIDNATNLSVDGAVATGAPTGFRITRSSGIAVSNATLVSPTIVGLNATQVDRFAGSGLDFSGGSVPKVAFFNTTNASVSNSTLSSTGFVLAVNQSRTVWVNDTTLMGGNPASAFVSGSLDVRFTNVAALGGVVGVFVQSSPRTTLAGVNATGAATDGVRVTTSGSFALVSSTLSGNGARGLAISSSPDSVIQQSAITANLFDGAAVSGTTLQVAGLNVSLNGRDGFVLTNGSLLNATGLDLIQNVREGLWILAGTHTVAGSTVIANGANGIRVDAGQLSLIDGRIENNTGMGFTNAGSSGTSWFVSNSGSLVYDEVVAVKVTVVGTLTVYRSSMNVPEVNGLGGILWFDQVAIAGPGAAGVLDIKVQGGTFAGQLVNIDQPRSLSVVNATMDWANVSVVRPTNAVQLDNTTATLADVLFGGPMWDGLAVVGGSHLQASRLTVHNASHFALSINASTASIADSQVTNDFGFSLGISIYIATSTVDLTRVASPSDIAVFYSQLTFDTLTITGAKVGLFLQFSDAVGRALAVTPESFGNAQSAATVRYSNLSLSESSFTDNWPLGALNAQAVSTLALDRVTIVDGTWGVFASGAVVTGTAVDISGNGTARIELQDGHLTLSLSHLQATSGVGILASVDSDVQVTDSGLGPFNQGGLSATGAGVISLTNVTVDSQGIPHAIAVNGATSFAMDRAALDALGPGISLHNVGAVTITATKAQAVGRALEVLNATSLTMSGVTLVALDNLAFEAADLGALTASSLTANGTVGALLATRITGLQLTAASLRATSGSALTIDTSPGAFVWGGTIAGASPALVTASPDARLDGLAFSSGGVAAVSSPRLRLANSTVSGASVQVTTTLDFVAYNLTVAPNAGQSGLWLSANSSADLGRLNITGGAYGVQGMGGPSLRLRNSVFAGQGNASVSARSYANLSIMNVSAAGSPTGFDLRYNLATALSSLAVSGATSYGAYLDGDHNATVQNSTFTFSGASGTGLRLQSSNFARVEHLTAVGGATGLMLHNATGAWIANGTLTGAQRGAVAANSSRGTLYNMTLDGLQAAGAVAYNSAALDFWSSSIAAAPFLLNFKAANASAGGLVRFYDSPADNATFATASNGTVEVYWSLRVFARTYLGPRASLPVSIANGTLGAPVTLTTGADGNASSPALIELRDTPAGRESFSHYTASASVGGFYASVAFDLYERQFVLLDLVDAAGPNLELRPTPPLVVRIPFNTSYAFGAAPGDGDNVGIVRYVWSFTDEFGALRTLESRLGPDYRVSYQFTKAGHYPVKVQAFDAADNPSQSPTDVVVWVNDPPFLLNPPPVLDLVAIQGRVFAYSFAASDNDTVDVPNLVYAASGMPGISFAGGILQWTPQSPAAQTFILTISDGYDTLHLAYPILVVSVVANNTAPRFVTDPILLATSDSDYGYAVEVEDPDMTQTVVIQMVEAPVGMTFTENQPLRSGALSWRPGVYYPKTANPLFVNVTVVLRAFDGTAFTYQNFTIALKNPPDKPPQMNNFTTIVLGPGDRQIIDLRQFAFDPDDANETLVWTTQYGDTAGADIALSGNDRFSLAFKAPERLQGTTKFFITIQVTDTSGLSDSRIVEVNLVGPTVVETAFPFLLILILVGGAGVAFALATRQRAAALAEEASAAPKGGGSSATSQALAPASGAGFPFYIEGAALYEGGDSLIAHQEADGVDLEEIWVLVPSKARDATAVAGVLRVVRLENHDIALLRDGDAMLAVVGVFAGDPTSWLEEPMKAAATQVQARASELDLQDFDALSQDAAVGEALRTLVGLSADSSREAVAKYMREAAVRAGSVVELVQGMVRLKVAVDNNSGQLAADARLSIEYDDKVLRLERLEPRLEQKRDKVQLGNLRPGERKTVAFYFDPQICTKSFFNATVTWEDAEGGFHSTAMRTRAAEVACPAFSTPHSANTAMLKRMLKEELAFRDSKYFRFPAQTSHEQVFDACKAAVLAQDVRLVKEIVTEKPYRAEAWFFGETKVKKAPMVIWTAVFADERVAQFSAASNAQASITGLLAELGRRLVSSRAGGGVGAPIESITKANGTAQVGDRATLLSKSESAEADSE